MPLLAGLTPNEMDALVHKMRNEHTSSEALIHSMVSNEYEEKLAKLSE